LRVLEKTDINFIDAIEGWDKRAKHDDEIDALAGAIELFRNSKMLKLFLNALTHAE